MAGAIDDFLNNVEKQLDSKQLKVGFIDGATYPDGTSVAMVATTNEYGRPEHNQPPRPFFRNAIANHESEWTDAIARGLRAGIDVNQVLEAVGAKVQGDIQESIAQLMDPPLSPATIKARKSKGNNSVKPLVDTKVMIGDVNYEVGEIEPSQDSQ
ncbi:hypothetical protein QNX20_004060 [Cronobacter sakazakii]|nr:hypothetical protein [Cronobacter sakazakii]